jgi:chromosome segregation ATPase
VVGGDQVQGVAALDAREIGAVSEDRHDISQQIPLSDVSGLIVILKDACQEFREVRRELKEVTSIKYDLTSVRESQTRTESDIKDIKKEHADSRKEHADGLREHGLEILALQKDVDACQETNKALQTAVKGLQDNMSGIFIKMAFCSGGALLAGWLIMQAIAIWDKMPHPKTASLPPMTMTRGKG